MLLSWNLECLQGLQENSIQSKHIAKKNLSFIFLTFSVFSGDLILIFYTCLHCLDKHTCFAWSRFILGWVIEWVGYKIFIEKEISDDNITIKNKSAKIYF